MIEQIAWALLWVAVGYGVAVAWKRYRQWRWMRRMAKSMLPVMTSEPREWFTLNEHPTNGGAMKHKHLICAIKGERTQNEEQHQFRLDMSRWAMSVNEEWRQARRARLMQESGVKLEDIRWEAGGLPGERAAQGRLAREIVMTRRVPTHRTFGGGVISSGRKEAERAAKIQCHCGARLTGRWADRVIVVECGTHGVIYTQGVRV